MKKLFYIFIILLLLGSSSLLKISVLGVTPKKAAGADHTEQPTPAGKEGEYAAVKTASTEGTLPERHKEETPFNEKLQTLIESETIPGSAQPKQADKSESRQDQSTSSQSKMDSSKDNDSSTKKPVDSSSAPDSKHDLTKGSDSTTEASTKTSVTIETETPVKTETIKTTSPDGTQSKEDTVPKGENVEKPKESADSTSKPKVTTEVKTNSTTETKTQYTTDTSTVSSKEPTTESTKCKHTWVWATHTETKTIPEVCHEEPVYNDGWDEAVTVRKIYCSECQNIYEDLDDYYDHDFCFGSFGHMTVVDHYIHHDPELLYYDTIVDQPAREETVTVKDYQYCSLCGERK